MLPSLPLSATDLSRFRVVADRSAASAAYGPHIRRKQGLALEFRDYRHYLPGDDIRFVDWGATFRGPRRGPLDWVVKTFDAEEQFTVLVALDLRPTMLLPQPPKLLAGLWIVMALARIVADSGDRMHAVPLFGSRELAFAEDGEQVVTRADQFAAEVWGRTNGATDWDGTPAMNSFEILARLPPAALLVVISDLYLDEQGADGVRELLIAGQSAYRHVVSLVLDSWPNERQAMARGPFKLQAIEGMSFADRLHEADDAELDAVSQRILALRNRIHDGAARGGLSCDAWNYPAEAELSEAAFASWFRTEFLSSSALQLAFGQPK